MRGHRAIAESLAIVLAAAALGAAQWQGIGRLSEAHETFTVRRINRLADKMLGQARRTKDDILLQQTVQAVAFMPGITWAAIVDPQNKIVAHSDPSQLGKTMRWRTHAGQWTHALEEGRQEWGKFAFGFSDAAFQRRATHAAGRQILLIMLASLSLIGVLLAGEKRRQQDKARLADAAALLEEAKAKSANLEIKLQSALSLGPAWMQGALSQFSDPALFLDAQQRVVAINMPALVRLGLSRPQDALLKSWHEFPLLQTCGTLLEQSLFSPMKALQAKTPSDGLLLSLMTMKEGGTWVAISSSNSL